MELTIHLPCTPKAYAWLSGKYGDSFSLSEDVPDHLFILSQITRNHSEKDSRINRANYKHTIAIKIRHKMYEQIGGELTLTAIQRINGYLEKQIRDILYPSIDLCLGLMPYKRGIIKYTILTFLEQNNLDPDIVNYEAVKKSYWRHRACKKERKLPLRMSS